MGVHAYNPSHSGGKGRRIESSKPGLAKLVRTLSQKKKEKRKKNKNKGQGEIAQVVNWVQFPVPKRNKIKQQQQQQKTRIKLKGSLKACVGKEQKQKTVLSLSL
jgi:hypothetical protein